MVRRKAIIMIAAVVLGGGGWSRADTFHFQQGAADPCHPEFGIYENAHDLTIGSFGTWPINNPDRLRMRYASGEETYNTLIRFEGIDSVLQGHTVRNASIKLTWQAENVAWQRAYIDTYTSTKLWDDPNCDWYDADIGVLSWDDPGAQHDPNDRGDLISTTDMGHRSLPGGVQYTDGQQFIFSLSPEIVQNWIDQPNSNNGLILTMNSDSAPSNTINDVTFSSSDDSNISARPILIITTCLGIPADINGDCYVDLGDYAILASQWMDAPGTPSADIAPKNGDGIVNFLDLQVLVSQWLQCSDPDNLDCNWGQ